MKTTTLFRYLHLLTLRFHQTFGSSSSDSETRESRHNIDRLIQESVAEHLHLKDFKFVINIVCSRPFGDHLKIMVNSLYSGYCTVDATRADCSEKIELVFWGGLQIPLEARMLVQEALEKIIEVPEESPEIYKNKFLCET